MLIHRKNLPVKPTPSPPEFALSPLARAGILVKRIQHLAGDEGHEVATPHRDAHYLLMLATRGRFRLRLDFEEVALTAPALLIIRPGQVHHLLESTEAQGWGVSFEPALLDAEGQRGLAEGLGGPLRLAPETAFYRRAVALLKLLTELETDTPDAYTGRATHALLAALLSLLAGQLRPVPTFPQPKEARGVAIGRAFSQLLHQHYAAWKQPAQYAAALAISVAHLNDTVKELTGTSVSAHLQQRAVLEAKRLLGFTSLSVREVGYAVGYDEPVYFGKLFKKVTGYTPLQFRQRFRE